MAQPLVETGTATRERKKILTIVHGVALREQQQLVELLVEAAGRLVDGGHHSAASRCQLAQRRHQVHGGGGVKPCATSAEVSMHAITHVSP